MSVMMTGDNCGKDNDFSHSLQLHKRQMWLVSHWTPIGVQLESNHYQKFHPGVWTELVGLGWTWVGVQLEWAGVGQTWLGSIGFPLDSNGPQPPQAGYPMGWLDSNGVQLDKWGSVKYWGNGLGKSRHGRLTPPPHIIHTNRKCKVRYTFLWLWARRCDLKRRIQLPRCE